MYCFVRTHLVPYCTKRHLLASPERRDSAEYFDTPLQVTAHVLSCLFFSLALFLSGGRNVRGCLSLKSLLRSDPGRLSLTIARKSRVRKKTKQGTEAKILFPVRRAFPFRFRLGTSQGARMYYMLYVVHRRPLCFLCHHVGGYGNAEGESTADMGRLCLALFEGGGGREGQRSPLCTLSAAGKDTWVETRGRREDNDSYDGMTSVDAAQGDDGEYGGIRATEEDHTTEWVGCMVVGAIWKRLDIEFPLPHHAYRMQNPTRKAGPSGKSCCRTLHG